MIKEPIINCKKLPDFFEKRYQFGLAYLKRNLPILSGKTPLQAGHCEKIGQVYKHISKSHNLLHYVLHIQIHFSFEDVIVSCDAKNSLT